jgi:two-component system, response regulator PdtaR
VRDGQAVAVSKDLLLINGTAVQERASADAKCVLVVEDEPLLLLMAGDMVEEAGLLPLFAGNADAAIRILESRDDIGVVFTDVRMPGTMDGLRLAAAVRDRWPPIRLMVVSGHLVQEPELPDDARFFRKPYPTAEIISTLRELAG